MTDRIEFDSDHAHDMHGTQATTHEAERLAKEYRPTMSIEVLHSWAVEAANLLRRIPELEAERERHSAEVQALRQELSRAIAAQAAQGESDVATWLWLRFADYCRNQGMNPHHQNDLFAIVHDLRAMLTSSPTPPAQQKGGEA